MNLLSAKDAAARLGLTVQRVRQLIVGGHIAASRVGVAWVIDEGKVSRFAAQERGPGWKKGRKRK